MRHVQAFEVDIKTHMVRQESCPVISDRLNTDVVVIDKELMSKQLKVHTIENIVILGIYHLKHSGWWPSSRKTLV